VERKALAVIIIITVKLFSLKQEKESQDNLTEATGLAPWSVTVG